MLVEKCRWPGAALAGRTAMAAPCAVVVSHRRPAEKRRVAASGQNLSDDAARLCARSSVRLAAARDKLLQAGAYGQCRNPLAISVLVPAFGCLCVKWRRSGSRPG